MADNEETAKLVDGAYKNILEKFNPSARHLISAGKAYLKALHGVVSASKTYIDALSKLASHSHQGTWGGCADIGTALLQLVDVQKEIDSQQLNILKAFYVDLIVPLESNIDKDTKVVLCEQKRFLQQHKCLQDSYLKAVARVKKQTKKNRSSKGHNVDKEIKSVQSLDEEKMKFDCFCERSLKQAIIQERRRFGFVLERQCSLTKHNLVYYSQGQNLLHHRINEWEEVAKGRESLPEPIDKLFPPANEFRSCGEYSSNILMSDSSLSLSGSGTLRKTRGIDTSCMDLREVPRDLYPRNLIRAKSDFNIASSSTSLISNDYISHQGVCLRPRSLLDGEPDVPRSTVRALYSYLSNGEHQLSFHEGDIIALVGNRKKGWQYGENQRNRRCGWFPIAYTEPAGEIDNEDSFDKSASEYQYSAIDQNIPSYMKAPVARSITAPAFHSFDWGTDSTYASAASSPLSGDGCVSFVSAIHRPFSTFMDSSRATLESLQEFRLDKKFQHSSSHSTNGPIASTTPTSPTSASMTLDTLQNPRCPLHGSNDSGFCNDGSAAAATFKLQRTSSRSLLGPEDSYDRDQDLKPKENIFASVKLRKVITNDRSAPILS